MNLKQWLEVATRGLSPLQRERIALEIRAHLEDAEAHLINTGLPREEARQQALEALGDPLVASRAFLATYSRPFLPQSLATIAYLLLSFPLGIFYFVVMITLFAVGLSLAWTYVGLPILALAFAASWGFATTERSLSAAFLGVYVARRPSPEPRGSGLWARAKAHVTHSGTWLDISYLFLRFPLGILAFVAAVVLVVVPLSLIFLPFAELVWNDTFTGDYTYVWPWLDRFTATTIATHGWMAAVVGVLLLPVSLYILNALAAFFGQLSQYMLGNGARGIAHRLNHPQFGPIAAGCLAAAVAVAAFYSSPFSPFPVPSMALAAESAIQEEKTLDLRGISQLELRADVATIRIVGNQPRAFAQIKRWGNQKYLLQREGDRLILKEQWLRNCRNCRAEIEVFLPQVPKLLVSNDVGPITLENLNATINVSSDTGSLSLRQIGGPITARTDTGTFTLETVLQGASISSDTGDIQINQLESGLKARSDTGQIRVSQAKGLLDLGSDSGSIEVRGSSGQIQIRSDAGEVHLEQVQLNPGLKNSLRTDSGPITISALNTSTGLRLQGRKDSGKLQVDLPGANTEVGETRFEVTLPGDNPVLMEVSTDAGAIQIK